MPGKKFGFLALIFIFTASVLIPALRTDIAAAQCSWMDNLSVVQSLNYPNDYRWQGNRDPRYDPDWQTHYGNTSHDYNLRCCLEYGCPACGLRQTGSTSCR